MAFITILKILSYIVTAGIPIFFGIKKNRKDKADHKKEVEKLNHKLAEEIRRFQEKQKQVSDLLEFQSNDSAIKTDMENTAEFLKNARSKDSVKDGLKKVSTTVRSIYNSR
jgi:oligoendopeptidase F